MVRDGFLRGAGILDDSFVVGTGYQRMNIFQEIKALFSLKDVYSKIQEAYQMDTTPVKPGWKTSEFWLTVISNVFTVVGTLKGLVPANVATIALLGLNGIYSLVRAITKSNAPDLPPVPPTPAVPIVPVAPPAKV